MKIAKWSLLVLMAVVALAAVGCRKPVPVYLKVTGTGAGEASFEAPAPPPPPPALREDVDMSWAEGDIVAIGQGVPPANAISAAQGRLMAKKAAELDALRNLAEQVQGVRINSDTTVRNFMTENDEIRTQVDAFIAGAENVDEREMEDGTYEVKKRLNLHPLSKIIPAGRAPISQMPPPAAPKSSGGLVSPAQARLMAERAAKMDCYRQLLESLKGVHITSTTTVEDFIAKNDSIRSRVEGIVRGARVVDRRFNSDGTVEVDMVLEHPDITQVVR